MKDYRSVLQLNDWMVVWNIKVNIYKGKIIQIGEISPHLQFYLYACNGDLAVFPLQRDPGVITCSFAEALAQKQL